MNRKPFRSNQAPAGTMKPLARAVRSLIAGGFVIGAGIAPARAWELPKLSSGVALSVTPASVATQGLAMASIDGNAMTIKQLSDKTTLDWKSFNIDAENSVRFDQPSSSSVALNRIHQADPSRIFGTLTANGQVYLVNQNGFVFGKNSQVNVNALVATTLGVSEDVFQRGIAKVFDLDQSAALQGNGERFIKDDQGNFVLDAQGQKIKIQVFVESGARIKTNAPGGRVILAAPVVRNEGSIETPDGQTILAAATDKVYLQEAGSDSDIRGLLVEVGTGGKVENVGKVLAERGNASLIGFAVNQKGIASATTSVRLNGTVRLLAREGIRDPSGTGGKLAGNATVRAADLGDGLGTRATVDLGSGSRTSVELDANKTATAIDAQPQQRSHIEISGHQVSLRGKSTVRAKSGKVEISALDNPADPKEKGNARIYLESGSTVDVSGVKNVSLAMERNVVEVELRKNELRDAPVQRNGVLFEQKVAVDLRDATLIYDPDSGELESATIPVADIKGAVDRIARNIDERSTSGGAIDFTSSGDVVTRPGSILDFSGGSIAYRDGYIETTKLVADGRIFDISRADPNRRYDGILGGGSKTYAKWGITERFSLPGFLRKHYEAGYVEGKDGGELNITAYEAMLDGVLKGETAAGRLQRTPGQRAAGSSLSIDLGNGNLPGRQDVAFGRNQAAGAFGANDPLPRKEQGSADPLALYLDPNLLRNSGVHHVAVKTNGAIRIQKGARVDLPVDGSLNLAATQFDVQGSIVVPSGDVNLHPTTFSSGVALPAGMTLGESAVIDVRGQWVNDWLAARSGGATGGPVSIDGGSVTLVSEQRDLRLEKGSRIDVSGGAWLQSDATVEGGHGGSIELVAARHDSGGQLASLNLNGELAGWGLRQGGSLSLQSSEVVIGPAGAAPVHAGSTLQPLILSPGFFQHGGFADYRIGSNYYGLKVADKVQLTLQQRNRQLAANAAYQATGRDLAAFSTVVTLPEALRNPGHLQLSFAELTGQNRQESLSIGKGAVIRTDAQGSVTLDSDTSVFVDGSIVTPGGRIAVDVNTPSVDGGFFASQGIWLGAESRLSAAGAFKPTANSLGLTTGEVLAGGSVELTANRGYIVSRAGSRIDVSGTAERLDFAEPSASGAGGRIVSRQIASAGGTVGLKAGEGILADGGFKANGGGAGAEGGTLSVELNRLLRDKPAQAINNGLFPDDVDKTLPRTLVVSAAADPVIPEALGQGGNIPSADFSGRALFKSTQLNDSGFDSLLLKTDALGADGAYRGSIAFQGDVRLDAGRRIVLDSPSIKTDGGTVTLDTAYAALGSTTSRVDTQLDQGVFSTTLAPAAQGGPGHFQVNAQGIDLVGGLSFDGFGQVNLNSAGDVRAVGIRVRRDTKDYLGELKVAGDLTITADQLYPATLTDYTISAGGAGGETMRLQKHGGASAPVYSAGGALTIEAPNIVQAGTLKAPFGTLSLNAENKLELADGSVTSVSGEGLTVPFGRGSGGFNWLYPLDAGGTTNLVIDAPPEKRLSLSGKDVALQQGAKVDLSGGGDLYAYEFIAGPGGSNDVLDPTASGYNPKFAVLPGYHNVLTPYDPLEFPRSGLETGDSVYLSGGGGLDAGWYTLLPARYALLPGAYLVMPREGTRDQVAAQNFTDLAGIAVVAGRYGTPSAGSAEGRWQGFAVEPGSVARTRSQYTDYSANRFFANQAAREGTTAPQLPRDAGSLSIATRTSLTLAAELAAAPAAGGRGGQVDIGADRLAIVSRREDIPLAGSGIVGLLAEDLNGLNAPSLLLGGTRSKEKNGQRVTVSSETVEVSGGTELQGREILLAARDEVKIASGASVASIGKDNQPGVDLLVANQPAGTTPGDSDGALLRVSAAGQAEVIRDQAVSGTTGVLVVESGARLAAEGSMLLDSTQNTMFDGAIDMQGGSLSLKSSRISLGDAPTGTPGLVLAATQFDLDELVLASATDLDIYGGVAVNTKQLAIGAARINGFDNAGETASISADAIELFNHGSSSARSGSGTGNLALNAREIRLGSGEYAISGFQQVSLNATESIAGVGQVIDPVTGSSSLADQGLLRVDGDLALNAGRFIGGDGATTRIDASGHGLTLDSPTDAAPAGSAGWGARWSVTADSIAGTGRFDLPSGILEFQALNGDIDLRGGSIDVSGQARTFGSVAKFSPGGTVRLTADQGDVRLASGARIDLAGASRVAGGATVQASDAGLLEVRAAHSRFAWNGAVDARGADTLSDELGQGRFRLDVDSFGAGGFSALNGKLAAAGFSGEIGLRQRSGDVTIAAADTVHAQRFDLAADQGAVAIDGTVDASGTTGGEVSVYGRNGIALAATGRILASAGAAGEAGGKVTLDTVHRDDSGSGLLDLSATGGLIDVSGGAGGSGGALHLRTGRDAGNAVAATAIHSTVRGADPLRSALEATRVYAGESTITTAKIAGWKTDTATFMAVAPALADHSGAALRLLPGVEIRGDGDLTLASNWDFMTWRYSGAPGYLTLRAGNDLNVAASLSDGFATSKIPASTSSTTFQNMLQPGQSWSYTLAAGKDVALGNPAAGSQVWVRTGTGAIDIQAGGDIRFNKNGSNTLTATVYTAGAPAEYTRKQLLAGSVPGFSLGGLSSADFLNGLDPEVMNGLLRYGFLTDPTAVNFPYAEYPTRGGDIRLYAAGNIDGVETGQKITDWLVRSGGIDGIGGLKTSPTAWGINLTGTRTFNQNLGSFGGGDVAVEAGNDVRNLSAMLPTTGKPFGTVASVTGTGATRWSENGVVENGGGNLSLSAGNDIAGGEYYLGRGTGRLSAGGSVAASATGLGAILDLGDGRFDIQARKDVVIGSALNPTVLTQTSVAQSAESRFFTYGENSAIDLMATAGNVVLQNDVTGIKELKQLGSNSGSGFEYALYPGTLRAAALSGDLRIDNSMTLFPSPQGKLELLANRNIGADAAADSRIDINLSDSDRSLLPSVEHPEQKLEGSLGDGIIRTQERLDPLSPSPNLIHAATPVHRGDASRPTVVAKLGDIAFPDGKRGNFFLPLASEFVAGRDIANLNFSGQNLAAGDVTRIQAGRNIEYGVSINGDGAVLADDSKIELGGPGQLQVLAGGDVNLGSSDGIRTIGDLLNPALDTPNGAGISVLAGLSDRVDYAGFIGKYRSSGEYRARLEALAGLNEEQQRQHLDVVLGVLFREIGQSAAAAAAAPESQRAGSYQRGFDAIQALFPGSDYQGDIGLVFSQIKTLAGGDIHLLAPGGQIDVGLAGQLAGLSKKADELGIVVQQEGDLNALTDGDFNVNASRTFAMGGGDILVWSSKGDIDAGKGAKSAIAAPPPATTVDEKGNIVTVFPPIISGSGIQAIGNGQVTLAAPQGVVDAGEAGISGGQITIAATAVLGASNIQASGGTVGVPTAVAPPAVPAGADGAATGATKSAQDSGIGGGKEQADSGDKHKAAVSILTTDVVGYGQCSVGDVREGKAGCGG